MRIQKNWLQQGIAIIAILLLAVALLLPMTGCDKSTTSDATTGVTENGTYTSKDEVATYIAAYGHLPSNYITKSEAEDEGWDSHDGNLDEVCPGKSIGGDKFSNREGLLPKSSGRQYYECDIDYTGGYRGAKRIIYSDDGLIFYTDDHYKTFTEID